MCCLFCNGNFSSRLVPWIIAFNLNIALGQLHCFSNLDYVETLGLKLNIYSLKLLYKLKVKTKKQKANR